MAESNGSLKVGNGHANGKLHGLPAGRRRPAKQSRSSVAWTFSTVARLATWASIFTILFRCPTSLEACDDSSPYICKPYFQVKSAVAPHVQPYYDQYAEPYVELARPYYATVESNIVTPARSYAVKYGAPWANKAQQIALTQWERNGQPQLVQLQSAARAQYDRSLAPHLGRASDAAEPYIDIAKTNALQVYYDFLLPGYTAVQPYAITGYNLASGYAIGTALPAAYWTWNKTYVFLDTTVWPQVRLVYLENVEPQLVRIGERLGRYKTNAKTGLALEKNAESNSAAESAQSSFSKPSSQRSTPSTAPATQQSTAGESAPTDDEVEYAAPVQAPPAAENESEKRTKAREMVAQDLDLWQKKFAAQADDGAADMEERVAEIADRMILQNANVDGKGLVKALETTVESELEKLRLKISTVVEDASSGDVDAEKDIHGAVRSAGVAIKEKAQAVRTWRESYDAELQDTVVQAADGHFQILDETRSLGLQQIGMRWAWTEGVTYKDWAKYHELKRTLNEWTDQLKQLIVSHPALAKAQDVSAQLEDDAMEIASAAATELARLKEVSQWKILAQDSTDNFESEAMKLAAEAAQQAEDIKDTVAEGADEFSATIAESFDQATSSVEEMSSTVVDAVNEVSEAVDDQSTAASQIASSVLSEGAEATDEAGAELTGSAADPDTQEATKGVVDEIYEAGENLYSAASESAGSILSDASSAVLEEPPSVTEHSEADEETPTVFFASEASETILGDMHSIAGNASGDYHAAADEEERVEVEEDPMTAREETPPSNTDHVNPVFLGAAAQDVPNRQPILDDYVDTDMISSATAAAAAAYSSALSAASDQYASAASVVSAQIYGTPKPVHEQLFASVSSAYDNAVAAASAKFSDAADAASGIYGTPTPTASPTLVDWKKVESIASDKLNEGRLWAELQYQSAVIALGLATPTPSSPTEKYYEQAKFNYYAGLGVAQDRYSSFIAAASSAMSSMTATPTPTDFVGSASSMASVAQESAASVARAAGNAAESAYSAATDNVASAAGSVDESIAAMVDAASEQVYLAGSTVAEAWDSAISELTAQIYGEQASIGWYESMFNEAGSYASAATEAVAGRAASLSDAAEDSAVTASAEAAKQYEAVSELVSELIVGKEAPFTESVLSRLGAACATAVANAESYASEASEAAASVADRVGSAASQATEAVKETVQHAKDEL